MGLAGIMNGAFSRDNIVAILMVSLLVTALLLYNSYQAAAYGGSGGPPPGSAIIDIVTTESGNSVYVLWAEYDDGRHDYSMWIRASHDGGHTFEKVIDLNNIIDAGNGTDRHLANIMVAAADPKDLYLAWTDLSDTGNNPDTSDHAYFMKSSDGGLSFSSPLILDAEHYESNVSQTQQQDATAKRNYGVARLIASGDSVHAIIAYSDNTVDVHGGFLLRTSNDAGETFGDAVGIFNRTENMQPWIQAAISADGKNVYAVATGIDKFEGNLVIGAQGIVFRASNDGGKSFGSTIDLNEGSNSAIFAPMISASGRDNVYVSWSEVDPSNKNLVYAYFEASNDSGKTFGKKIKLDTISQNSSEIINSDFVQLAANENVDNVYVKWWDVHFTPDLTKETARLLFRASHDAGKTFADAVELTSSSMPPEDDGSGPDQHVSDIGQGSVITPKNVADNSTVSSVGYDGRVYITWIADVGDYPDIASSRVFLKGSTDGGNTFDIGSSLPQNDTGSSALNSRIASAADNIYVAWDSGSPGVHGLFFSASKDGGNSFADTIDLVRSPEQPIAMPEFGSSLAAVIAAAMITSVVLFGSHFARFKR